MIDTEHKMTTNQQDVLNFSSCKICPNPVQAIKIKRPNPSKREKVKNLFLKGLLLKQLSFVLAVNIKNN